MIQGLSRDAHFQGHDGVWCWNWDKQAAIMNRKMC